MTIPERVRRVLDRRRSNAAGFHKQKPRDADWLAEYEQEIDHLEPGELED
ncbi:hypothetical protein [Mycobacterium phage WXIN]|nr:hypothetical protein [Mycobacterium phage WXIN]